MVRSVTRPLIHIAVSKKHGGTTQSAESSIRARNHTTTTNPIVRKLKFASEAKAGPNTPMIDRLPVLWTFYGNQ